MEASLTAIPFATMPAHARVWIYKSAVAFTPEQSAEIRRRGEAFTGSWVSHGDTVAAAFALLHDHFLVIAADLADMVICGGSVDKSVQMIKGLERDLGLNLTDRMVVLHEADGGIRACRMNEIEALIKTGVINGDTIVFDDLVATKGDLDTRFRTALRNTWMSRYL